MDDSKALSLRWCEGSVATYLNGEFCGYLSLREITRIWVLDMFEMPTRHLSGNIE